MIYKKDAIVGTLKTPFFFFFSQPEQATEMKNGKMRDGKTKKGGKPDKQTTLFGRLVGFFTELKAAKKEEKKDAKNRFGYLGRQFSEGFKGFKDSFKDMIPTAKEAGVWFFWCNKKALIGFLLFLPKILNSEILKKL